MRVSLLLLDVSWASFQVQYWHVVCMHMKNDMAHFMMEYTYIGQGSSVYEDMLISLL